MKSVSPDADLGFYSWSERGFLNPEDSVLNSPIADGDRILLVALRSAVCEKTMK